MISKYFILHADHTHLEPLEVKGLTGILYKDMHIGEFCSIKPSKDKHNYAPWLFEHAYARDLAKEIDTA